jgi:hypothetical protein
MQPLAVMLGRTVTGTWTPGIGDPTLLGWLTVFAYFGAAYLCRRAARRALTLGTSAARLHLLWLGLTWAMVALGVNKQLDLQSLFTEIGKAAALEQGWYAGRHRVQRVFIGSIVAASALGGAALAWWMRRELRTVWLAALGTVFIVAFVLVRASSFHHVDVFLSNGPGDFRMNWLLELSGIACVAIGARRFRGRARILSVRPVAR